MNTNKLNKNTFKYFHFTSTKALESINKQLINKSYYFKRTSSSNGGKLMEKFFWREKNANKFIEEFTVISPTKQELLDEIIKKFYEKLEMINVIFDNAKRNEYLSKKSKTIPEGTPEIVIQQKIGTRVIIDFLQLIKDVCELKNLHLNFLNKNSNKSKEEIFKSIENSMKNLKTQTQESLIQIFYDIMNLINLLSLNYDKMECERQKVEEKEGSFYKGKFVIK